MEKLSDYISKQIISTDECEILGYILNVNLTDDLKEISSFEVVDYENEQSLKLLYEDIKCVNKDCVFVQNSFVLKRDFFEILNNPIGKKVYDLYGFDMGVVQDVFISKNKVKSIVGNKGEIAIKYIINSGRDCLIFGNIKKKQKFLKTPRLVNNLPNVYIESSIAQENKDKKDSVEVKSKNPIRLFANERLLIGRVVMNDIFGFNNEIIAKKNSVISENIINKAKIHNKFNLLIFYSK